MPNEEPFSNPMAPPGHTQDENVTDSVRLTNADFRKLLMTPRATPKEPPPTAAPKPKVAAEPTPKTPATPASGDAGERRKKRKSFYAQIKKEEVQKEKELLSKYRDRAKERREDANPDYTQQEDYVSTTANYKAVAPDAKVGADAAERRHQIIRESKFLGGDMEHTHLVKGLDYALLQKVRSEIQSKELEDTELENVLTGADEKEEATKRQPTNKVECKTRLGKNVMATLFERTLPLRNELFMPGRMAYKIELDDDYAESDIPSTVIRSKADLPNIESSTTLSTNDIVVNKLTQILSYLRSGVGSKKRRNEKKAAAKLLEEVKKLPGADSSIYDDVGEYKPGKESRRDRDKKRDRDRDRERDRHRDKGDRRAEKRPTSYFEKPPGAGGGEAEMSERERKESVVKFIANVRQKYHDPAQDGAAQLPAGAGQEPGEEEASKGGVASTLFSGGGAPQQEKAAKGQRLTDKSQNYAECYPGMAETDDAVYDSDEETDYMKMDMGSRKGPVRRWDFDSQDQYESYMAQREALPKAAFQYGVKMTDGRKTRRTGGPKDEKAQLDRQWQKIQQIISKKSDGPQAKVPKYS